MVVCEVAVRVSRTRKANRRNLGYSGRMQMRMRMDILYVDCSVANKERVQVAEKDGGGGWDAG